MPPVQPLQFTVPTTQALQKPNEISQKSSDIMFKNTFSEVKKQQATLGRENSVSAKSANANAALKSTNKPNATASTSINQNSATDNKTTDDAEEQVDIALVSPASDMLMLVNDAALHLQKSDTKLSNLTTEGTQASDSKTNSKALTTRANDTSDLLTSQRRTSGEPQQKQLITAEIKEAAPTAKLAEELEIETKPNAEFATTMQSAMALTATMAKEISKAAQTEIAPRVGHPGWSEAVGQKVLWMVTDSIQSATLTLNPPDLGPVEIVLSVENDQASASFTAAHLETQQALESALPKLRDMMESAGVKLGETTINLGFSQGQSESGQYSDKKNAPQSESSWSDLSADPSEQTSIPLTGSGLINTYA